MQWVTQDINELMFKSPDLSAENTIAIQIQPKDPKSSKGNHCFGVSYEYQVPEPEPNPESPLELTASQSGTESLTKCTILIKNKDDEEKGMLMCIVSLQTGLKVNLNDLEGLRRNEVVDFYELKKQNSEVVLYWRGIEAKGSRQVELAFLKEFTVKKAFPTLVSTYLYYDKSGSLISQLL